MATEQAFSRTFLALLDFGHPRCSREALLSMALRWDLPLLLLMSDPAECVTSPDAQLAVVAEDTAASAVICRGAH